MKTEGDTVTILFYIDEQQNDVEKQNTYYLTPDPEHEVIKVLLNGELVPFDEVTSL